MINYKHLYYFWVVAKQGGITRAGERLHLTPQTISGQISLLEDNVGAALFSKAGRNLELTDTGRLVLGFADDIFSLGSELEETLRNLPPDRRITFRVGIADVVPKTIAYRLLAPVFSLTDPVRLICRENNLASLLAELALQRLDMVIADGPIPYGVNVRGYNHVLGDCGISFLAIPGIARKLRKDFPRSLNNAPFLIPSETNLVQARLLDWMDRLRIHPRIVGEFDDSALMKVFGQAGTGVFIAPSSIASEVAKQYGAQVIGETEAVREEYYAITVERRISHPAVSAITQTAREWLG